MVVVVVAVLAVSLPSSSVSSPSSSVSEPSESERDSSSSLKWVRFFLAIAVAIADSSSTKDDGGTLGSSADRVMSLLESDDGYCDDCGDASSKRGVSIERLRVCELGV